MWLPISINLKNLFTHEDTTFFFKQGEMLLLTGLIGSGKSSVAEAITLAITGKVSRGVSKERFIRFNQDQADIEFVMRKGDLTFKIERTFFNGNKAAQVKLYENDELIRLDKLKKNAQDYIYDTIGIVEKDLLDYYIIGQGNNNSFYGSTDTAQKEVIARFSNYTGVNNIIAQIQLDVKAIDEQLTALNSKYDQRRGAKEALEDELRELVISEGVPIEERKQQIVSFINKTTADIKTTVKRIDILQVKIAEKENQVAKQTKEIKLAGIQFKNDTIGLEQLECALADLRSQMKEAHKLSGTLDIMSGKVILCPKCGFEFIPDAEYSPKQVESNMTTLREFVIQCDQDIREKQKEIQEVQERLNAYEATVETADMIQIRIDELNEDAVSQQENLNNFQGLVTQQKELLKQLTSRDVDKETTIADKIKATDKELAAIEIEIDNLTKQRASLEFHEFHYGKAGFKTFLANKSIKIIQDITNYYLEKFQTDLQVYISPITALKSGEVRDKIEINIIRGGIERGVYDQFSGGERSVVDICGIIALHKIINNSSETGGLDLLFMDEKVRHLDSEGQLEIIRIFEKSKITSALILHHADNVQCKNRRYFLKENKITTVYDKNGFGKKV